MRKEIVLLLTFMLSASVNAQSKVGMHLGNDGVWVGMHLGNDGVWEKPTFQSALEALESDYQPTIAVLATKVRPRRHYARLGAGRLCGRTRQAYA